MLRGEVADDRVRLAHHEPIVDHAGHLPDRVELEEFRRVGRPEAASVVLALKKHADFVAEP